MTPKIGEPRQDHQARSEPHPWRRARLRCLYRHRRPRPDALHGWCGRSCRFSRRARVEGGPDTSSYKWCARQTRPSLRLHLATLAPNPHGGPPTRASSGI